MLRLSRLVFASALVGAAGCSWARFDDVQKDAPVVVLEGPAGVSSGFGSSLATARADQKIRVLVASAAGTTGAGEFELGVGQSPGTDAVRVGHCNGDCRLARGVAGMGTADVQGQPRTLCFASGYAPTLDGAGAPGIRVQCEDEPAFIVNLKLPAGVAPNDPTRDTLVLNAAPDGQWMLAALPSQSAVWRYDSPMADNVDPVALVPGQTPGETYGLALAIFQGSEERFLVGEPGEGRVWVFQTDGTPAGCISGPPGFGRAIAVGTVEAGSYALAVSDAKSVHVLDGQALQGLGSACAPFGNELVQLPCRETPDVEGCGGGEFGAALAIADIDGDQDGEVIVGAPGMTVRGETSAGAVEVFDVEGAHLDWLTEAKFVSSGESGDRLGAALAVAHQPSRDLILAGAPGGGKAAIFYCSKLLPPSLRGARCQ